MYKYKFDFMNGNVEIDPQMLPKLPQQNQLKRVYVPYYKNDYDVKYITLSFIFNQIGAKKIHWQKAEINSVNHYNKIDCKIINCEHCLTSNARTEYVSLIFDENIEPKILTYHGQIIHDEIEMLTWYNIYKTGRSYVIAENKTEHSTLYQSNLSKQYFAKMFDDFCKENSYRKSEI